MRTIASTVLSGCLVVAVCACGGKSKGPSTAGGEGEVGEGDEGIGQQGPSNMVPPEKFDEIETLLNRKKPAAARCLVDAVNAGKADKRTRGKIRLAFVIGRNGKARDIKVTESTVQNDEVERCVMDKVVASIDFGMLSKDLDWSYAYVLESF